jgi:hypothetical protein
VPSPRSTGDKHDRSRAVECDDFRSVVLAQVQIVPARPRVGDNRSPRVVLDAGLKFGERVADCDIKGFILEQVAQKASENAVILEE